MRRVLHRIDERIHDVLGRAKAPDSDAIPSFAIAGRPALARSAGVASVIWAAAGAGVATLELAG